MAVGLFYSYSHRDEDLRAELEKHLSLLRRSGHISEWHDRRLEPGSEWKGEIDDHLRSAQVILLLISADFLASDYCYDIELKVALERHDRGEAVVIPIILRPVEWMSAPFARLQGLPKDAKPVTSWANRDEAFADVARGIREVVMRRFAAAPGPAPIPQSLPPSREQERVLDAALPKQVTVGDPAELLAMIRRSASGGLRAILHVEEEPGVAPEDVRSQPFHLEFPLDLTGELGPVTVSLRVESPQFEPKSQSKELRVPPAGDSEVCRFLLVPQAAGQLTVMLEAVIQGVYQTSRLLRTSAGAQALAQPAPLFVVSMPLFTASTVLRSAPFSAPAARATESAPSAQTTRILPPAPQAPPAASSAPVPAALPTPVPKRGLGWASGIGSLAAVIAVAAILVQYRTGYRPGTSPHAGATPPVEAPSAETAEIQVTVVDPEGKPVAGALVRHGEESAVTGPDGRVALRTPRAAANAGSLKVSVKPPGGRERQLTVSRHVPNRLVVER